MSERRAPWAELLELLAGAAGARPGVALEVLITRLEGVR